VERLAAIARKRARLVVGLLSGTSADALDAAVCSIEGGGPGARVRLEAFGSRPLDPALRERIAGAGSAGAREIAELHGDLGEAFAEACLSVLVAAGVPEEAVDLVGSHGQTVHHHSGEGKRSTLQLGDGDRIAERTGFPVVSDFRARDVAAGGEGAPLTPYADLVLFAPTTPEGGRRAVLNLGGIANVTILDRDPARVVAFDTGPANAPLDRLARRISGGELSCDAGGELAAKGEVDRALLAELLRHPFLARRPPKSTGTEAFGDAFVDGLVARRGRADASLLATATAFVAESVAAALRAHAPPGPAVGEVVVAGGGVRNGTLLARLREALPGVRVVPSDERGVPARAREAMAFALLANDACLGLPTNLPRVTGARRAATLGKLSFPALREGAP
jgi:anhydro-N-acetylmuramic acid kinase